MLGMATRMGLKQDEAVGLFSRFLVNGMLESFTEDQGLPKNPDFFFRKKMGLYLCWQTRIRLGLIVVGMG